MPLIDLLRTGPVFRTIVIWLVILAVNALLVTAFWVTLVIFEGRSRGC